MQRSFRSSSCYDPAYSLLGRALRRWTGDRLRGEAWFIVALTGLALVLLMTHYLGWALLQSYLSGHPSRQLLFWTGQLVSVGVWSGVGLVGFRPGVTATCTDEALRLKQGGRAERVPHDAIEQATLIPPPRYHRHYRRYAATTVFVGRLGDAVLLLRTADGPVAIGLPDADALTTLKKRIDAARSPAPEAPVPSEA